MRLSLTVLNLKALHQCMIVGGLGLGCFDPGGVVTVQQSFHHK